MDGVIAMFGILEVSLILHLNSTSFVPFFVALQQTTQEAFKPQLDQT